MAYLPTCYASLFSMHPLLPRLMTYFGASDIFYAYQSVKLTDYAAAATGADGHHQGCHFKDYYGQNESLRSLFGGAVKLGQHGHIV